jgi:transposase
MERIPRGVYTQEFRAEAVRLIEQDGVPITEVSRRLSVPKGSLKKWLYTYRSGKLGEIGKHQKPMTEAELELARLRKELAEVKLERDLLKKCAAYFAKESR